MQSAQPAQPERLVVGPDQDGQRLDRVVGAWRGLSRAAVLRLLVAGGLIRNGRVQRRADKGAVVRRGDVIEIDARHAGAESPAPDDALALRVLSQGEGWLVVDKPAGAAVRPHAIGEVGTVMNAVAARFPQVAGVGEGGLRSGVVHRLDTDTSGTLVVAYEQAAWQRLRQAFAMHAVAKRYVALVHGEVEASGTSELYLCVTRHSPSFVEANASPIDGQRMNKCSLDWRVIERFGDRASLIEVDLHTGFLHQVRVMMAHRGHPVVGDRMYGGADDKGAAARQMLHASSVVFEEVAGSSGLPCEMLEVMAGLRE